MRCSICIATHDRPLLLRNTLRSIFQQSITDSGDVEVIVVDDRSSGVCTQRVCEAFPVRYIRLDGDPGFKNPSRARNVAYKAATGDIVICQSDDVIHGHNAIHYLTEGLHQGEFLIATVWNVDDDLVPIGLRGYGKKGEQIKLLTGVDNPRPLFFLGSLWRRDLYAVGGNDEDFVTGGREDVWFADCLVNGAHLKPRYVDVLGYHQDHGRPDDLMDGIRASSAVYKTKRSAAQSGQSPWRATGGSWNYGEKT